MIRITINADTIPHARPFSTVGSASHEHIRRRGPGRQKRKLRLGGTDVGEETGPKPFSLWGRNGESCSQCPDPHGACLTFTAVTWLAWWGRQSPPPSIPHSTIFSTVQPHTQPKELHRPSVLARQSLGTSQSHSHTTALNSHAWRTISCLLCPSSS